MYIAINISHSDSKGVRRVSNISEKLDFHDPFHKKVPYSHFGAKNDQAIRIRKFFEELGL